MDPRASVIDQMYSLNEKITSNFIRVLYIGPQKFITAKLI